MKILLLVILAPCVMMGQPAPLLTNFPSLTIPASSRGWSMGNTGIASSVDNQSLSYNVARAAFTQNLHQVSLHYMPWLPGISNDSRFIHAGYISSLENSAIGVSINYLNLGTIAMRDDNGATLGLYKTSEYHIGGSCALQLGGNAALGATLRFFGQNMPAGSIKNTYSVAGDIGYYQSFTIGDASRLLSCGAVVSNLGANINLPTTAGIGVAYTNRSEGSNHWMITAECSRLWKDDWKGLRLGAGAEYSFMDQFFLRGGMNIENRLKGNRKFISLGAGYKGLVSDQALGLDLYYLVPFGVTGSSSPFQNSYGLTLSLNIGNFQ